MAELSGQLVDLVEVLGADGRRLGEQLRQTPSWRRRFGLVDRFLLGRLEGGPRPSPEVAWVWERLVSSGGAVPIGRLAREVGWSHKHLIARFCQQVGLRPKTAARLVRFEGVWRRLDQVGGRLDWGQGAGRSISFKTRSPPPPSLADMRDSKEELMTATTEVLDLVRSWARAEQGSNAQALEGLLADDFVGVGPAGWFVLGREQWLARFGNGLENRAFAVEDAQVRDYGTAAVVVGVLAQETSFQGRDNSGRFRLTLVAARPGERWLLANAHIGPLQPAGPPPS